MNLCMYVCMYMCVYVRVCLCARVCTWVCTGAYMCAIAAPPWQGVSIMINRQTRQLSHAITLHYGSQDFKVKMNGSSLTWRLHISSFFVFSLSLSLLFFGGDLSPLFRPPFLIISTSVWFCLCLGCITGQVVSKKKRSCVNPSFACFCKRIQNEKIWSGLVLLNTHHSKISQEMSMVS